MARTHTTAIRAASREYSIIEAPTEDPDAEDSDAEDSDKDPRSISPDVADPLPA